MTMHHLIFAPRRVLSSAGMWLLASLLLCAPLQLGATGADKSDPPARMGRLSLVVGPVEARVDDKQPFAPALLNLPLGSASRVRTAPEGRAEVRVGSVSAQLEGNSHLVLRTVEDDTLALVLFYGELGLHVPNLPGLGTGQRVLVYVSGDRGETALAFRVTSPGRYHFLRRGPASVFNIQAFEGQGQVVGINPVLPLAAGRQIGVSSVLRQAVEPGADGSEARETAFTQWAAQRAKRGVDAQSLRHVSAEMTGAEELEKHGSWNTDARWGALWVPAAVDADWAPYRQGRWVFTSRHGWAWVDDAAWGFAPFHYGRWLFNAGRWAWSPGARVEKPVYAPALVGFYATSPEPHSWLGWFPLAPGEAYRPAFEASTTFTQNLNAPAFERLVSQGYRYANTLFAATAMTVEGFTVGKPAAASVVRLSANMLTGAGVLADHGPPAALRPVPPLLPAPAQAAPKPAATP
jgi:hypothetical protein